MKPPESAHGRKRIALVIGSGSVKCAAAIGIQTVLKREGFELDMVVGCSAGAMYAAVMAAGHDADVAADMTRRLWTKEVANRRNTRSLLQTVAPRWLRFDKATYGLRDDRMIMQRLQSAFGDTRIGLGRENAKEYFKEHPELLREIEQLVLTKFGIVKPPVVQAVPPPAENETDEVEEKRPKVKAAK